MKKLFTLMLALCLALTSLVVPAVAEEPYNIVYAFNCTSSFSTENIQRISELISKRTMDTIGCTVTLLPIPFSDWSQRMNMSLATPNEQIDVIGVVDPLFTPYLAQNQILDILEPVNRLFPEYEQENGSALLGCGMRNGKLYSLPTITVTAASRGLYLNRELCDQYNVDVDAIQSLADLAPIMAQIKADHPDMYPYAAGGTTSGLWTLPEYDALSDNNGGLMHCSTSTEVINPYATEEYRNFLLLMYDWYEAGYISPDSLTRTTTCEDDVKDGTCFACLSPNAAVRASHDTDIYYKLLTAPVATTGDMAYYRVAVPHNCKNVDKAVEFIKLLFTDKTVLDYVCWGEQGVDYVLDDEGRVSYSEDTDFNSIYVFGAPFMVGSEYVATPYSDYPADYADELRAFNKTAIDSTAAGFTFDNTPVASQIAAISNTTAEYVGALETGMVHPDDMLPDFLQKLEQAGINEVIAAKQQQLNDWLATR